MEAIAAAEEFGDPDLTARVIGAYDVPAIWTRNDDPEQARRIVDAAERALTALPGDAHEAARCRLLATIALETRGSRAPRGPQAAREAEEIARRLDDPALLAFALNGAFMQSFTRAGLAPRRDEIGAELVELAARHDLVTYEVLGHLIRLQARGALADFAAADRHAAAVDRLAERHELPLASVFTQWYRALRLAASGQPAGPRPPTGTPPHGWTAQGCRAWSVDFFRSPCCACGCGTGGRGPTPIQGKLAQGLPVHGVPVHEVPIQGRSRSTWGRTGARTALGPRPSPCWHPGAGPRPGRHCARSRSRRAT